MTSSRTGRLLGVRRVHVNYHLEPHDSLSRSSLAAATPTNCEEETLETMIQSFFLLSPTGEALIERHFRGVVSGRSVCEEFWQFLINNYHKPVMEVASDHAQQGTLHVISIRRDGLSYLAICPNEVSPLMVLELLNRFADIFRSYFGNADETSIKENFSTVYQLLEEMVDHGWALTTEDNALKALIRPPNIMSKLLSTSNTAVSESLPMGTVSRMPWRTSPNIQYSNNEIYVDIVEQVDAILDRGGNVVMADVQGSIQCQSHLSGLPDLLLTFNDPSLIDDCSFHPCVRLSRFERESVISFVPPDGDFELMRYRMDADKTRAFMPPVFCQAQWSSVSSNEGRLQLQVGVTRSSNLVLSSSAPSRSNLMVEQVSVTIPFPKGTTSTSHFAVSMGTYMYDESTQTATWKVTPKMDANQNATLSCKFTLSATQPSSDVDTMSSKREPIMSERRQRLCSRRRRRTAHSWLASPPTLKVGWKVPLASVSGISVSGLSLTGEAYRPYKGVRNITSAGPSFLIRCS